MSYNFDPELAPFVAMLPATSLQDAVAARAGLDEMVARMQGTVDVSGLEVVDRTIDGPVGAGVADTAGIPVRIYTPVNRGELCPGLLYIHGGGFVVGNLESEHASAAMIARETGVVVVSVDYRLAPEHPWPAGLEDCYAALCWVHQQAQALGVDTARIGVMGQSAGGGLAAALALLNRDRKGPPLCFQYLGIPELDDRLETVSMQQFVDTPLWARPNAELSWQYYLGDRFTRGSGEVPACAAPARAEDVHGLPPAYISVMEFDPLRDEGILYAMKLMAAGVAVELHAYPGTFHGSSLIGEAAVSRRQRDEMLEVLHRGLRTSSPGRA